MEAWQEFMALLEPVFVLRTSGTFPEKTVEII